jgi:cell wall integrity and stress response component
MNRLHLQHSSSLVLLLLTCLLLPISAQNIFQGCYKIDKALTLTNTSIFQSLGLCSGVTCGPRNFAVLGMTIGSECLCGNSLPTTQVTPEHCNIPCPGYPDDTCIARIEWVY